MQAGRQAGRQTNGHSNKDRQAAIETDRQTGKQTDRQTGKQTDRQAGRQTDRQAGRQTDRQRYVFCLLFLSAENVMLYFLGAIKRWTFQVIANGTLSVDSFFVLRWAGHV